MIPRGTWGGLVTGGFPVPVVDVAQAKLQCRIDTSDEDALVAQWIQTATRMVETETQTRLMTQTWDIWFDAFPSSGDPLVLPAGPIQSVTSVKYYDSTPTQQTWGATNYVVDTVSVPGRIGLADTADWPTDLRGFQPITVRAVLGWTPETVPTNLVNAVLLLVAHFALHREAVSDTKAVEVPLAYYAMLDRMPTAV